LLLPDRRNIGGSAPGSMKNNIREICGNWDRGFVLDKHTLRSEYTGDNEYGHPTFATTRSEVGEALYQLKYRGNYGNVAPLAGEIVDHLVPKFGRIGLVIPIPPSRPRPRQPVVEIAREVAKAIGVESFEGILVKKPAAVGAAELKNVVGKEAKVEALKARYEIADQIKEDGKWNVLVVDDLFDTGASMEAACALLRTYNKIGEIYVAALTWK
jgi:predicted amidophosphoribosyltransferase